MDWKKYISVCIIILLIISMSVIFVNYYFFPRTVDEGLYFILDVEGEDTGNMTIDEIYQNLSERDDLISTRKTQDMAIVKSEDWKYVNNITIKVSDESDLEIFGTSSVFFDKALERGRFRESSDNTKEKVRFVMRYLGVEIEEENIEIGDLDFEMMDAQLYTWFIWFMIFFGAAFAINNLYKNRKYILKKKEDSQSNVIYKFNVVDGLMIALILFVSWFIMAISFGQLNMGPDLSAVLAGIVILSVGVLLYLYREKYKEYFKIL